ncbi:DEAD/DEAH box helicase [Roseomonas eburnea]|uniref:DEAD/DEAH box helicase n=1 Tax=Neoroseomonas eburnea TaxID=1346889 RepID=A0A9X9XI18_9PROT|nr:DEAD/DEAH box helicase [Neoroseomonas eburnea]MBR0683354.1 DEAD/DEAH box helicase [Neoroseomonas eburnea]
MMQQLITRVWENQTFHDQLAILRAAWLRRELKVEEHPDIAEGLLAQSAQAAAILSTSDKPEHLKAAFSAVACAADLGRERLPGLDGVLRIVLTQMGNFPALKTAPAVGQFARLPTRLAIAEEIRRELNRVAVGTGALELTDFQRSLWNVLESGDNVAISAPTSAGKSFVLQAHLRSRARAGKLTSAVYLVPSRALIAQVGDAVATWMREEGLEQLSLVTIPLSADVQLREPAIYVLTQERLQAILTSHPNFRASLIICDEAQGIEDGARGVLLHNVVDQLLERNPSAQVVFAGPNICNAQAFGAMFNLKLLREVESRSPSVVQNLILVNTRSLEVGRVNIERLSDGTQSLIGDADLQRPLPTIKERLVRVAERFGRDKPSILYANGPKDAEDIAKGLKDVFKDVEPVEAITDLIALVKNAVHSKYDLVPCLRRGVGFHYGRIPALVRRGIETAFAEGHIRYLVTTSTLIQGVNFPAANLFVCKPKKGAKKENLDPAEFWNLAGRAGRLGKELQGNIFLIDYQDWDIKYVDAPHEIEIASSIGRTLKKDVVRLIECAENANPPLETEERLSLEATFARLLSDHMSGRLADTFNRYGVPAADRASLSAALEVARDRVRLPLAVLAESPTVSAIRQQRLADYLASEIKGGGSKRIEELMPRHPRDDDAYVRLSEVFKICHRQLLSLDVKKLHSRMAAIAVRWMRGDPVPEIVNENHRRTGGTDIAKSIRETLKDIEQDIRFKYLRLTSCYLSVLAYVLRTTGHEAIAARLPNLPSFLEVGAADQTMISFLGIGITRVTARALTHEAMDKNMDMAAALKWLRDQAMDTLLSSRLMREEVERALRSHA